MPRRLWDYLKNGLNGGQLCRLSLSTDEGVESGSGQRKDQTVAAALGSVLCSALVSLVASFLNPNCATVEDLQKILQLPTTTFQGLDEAVHFDIFFSKAKSFAVAGFKHSIITAEKWTSFLLEAAAQWPADFKIYFDNARSTELRKVLFPSEVWAQAFLCSGDSDKNMLAIAASRDVMRLRTYSHVSQLKHFVSEPFFHRLATERQGNGMLPVQSALWEACFQRQSLPTVQFLRSLLPSADYIATNVLNLTYCNREGRLLTFVGMVRETFEMLGDKRALEAEALVINLVREMQVELASVQWHN